MFLQFGKTIPVYVLKGHEEKSISKDMTLLKTSLELENYEVKELDLLTESKVPDDCISLIIASPQKDFAEIEANYIKEYIERGGNILWLNNPFSVASETPNMKSVLEMYGVILRQDGFIIEKETSKMVMGNPDLILPTVNNLKVTQNVSSILLLDSGKIEFVDDNQLDNLGVTKTDILKSSEKSFFRTNIELGNMAGISVADGEKEEASVLAALLEKKVKDDNTSNLIIVANNLFAEDRGVYVGSSAVAAIGFYNNKDFVLNSVSYLSEVEDPITIRKELKSTSYTATETQDRIVKTIIFGLPIVIILVGIVVWQLRRRKK